MDSAIRMLGLKADFFGPHHFFLSVAGGQHLQLPKGANGFHAKHAKPQRTCTNLGSIPSCLVMLLVCISRIPESQTSSTIEKTFADVDAVNTYTVPFTLRIEETKQNDIMLLLKQLLLRFRCSTFFLVGATSLDTCQTAVSTIQGQFFQYALLELNCGVAESESVDLVHDVLEVTQDVPGKEESPPKCVDKVDSMCCFLVFSMSVVPGACAFEVQRWCEAAKSRIKNEHPILHWARDEEDKHPVLPS